MTVDNSIVVLEAIESARRRGLARLQAAVEGAREVWPAVLASTLTSPELTTTASPANDSAAAP